MNTVKWPNGAKCAVSLSFDFDSETNWISRDPANINRPGTLSYGTYGAKVGVPKILELLREEELPATFFVPGWVAENRTQRVEMILKDGHEIAHHGYLHKWPNPDKPDEVLEEMDRGLEALEKCVGVRPVGYRSPAGETTMDLLRLLTDRGFLYDSSLLDDVVPYQHVLDDGRPGPVELPWHWSTDDAPYLFFTISVPRPMATNEHILSIWKKEFEALHSWGAYLDLVMHPQGIGRPSRLTLLREFIAYMREFDGVWFASCEEIAQAYLDQREGEAVREEINPFITLSAPRRSGRVLCRFNSWVAVTPSAVAAASTRASMSHLRLDGF